MKRVIEHDRLAVCSRSKLKVSRFPTFPKVLECRLKVRKIKSSKTQKYVFHKELNKPGNARNKYEK